ncbi:MULTISPECIES: RNA polymerase sigma factor FliA [Alcaligenes]|uniref:RNA polymerase sigma factor FliA n=1 Tax=Alcaligenes TaxID=507 RepID=UPI0002AA66B0|nr:MULTISPECIES: RNA polymerase sigma factor FliA [Alcaligenes]EKU30187.1 RNA polymerase sigma factor for flagellar operon [Alcaligenes sp. HPC1271]ERI35028.1 RNA polymerase sigma70 [Alcaligenes sp. EGD-AK7]UTM01997.1 RNA polymerase sigma factor FliA [Alcaligenes sp. NLF5-7]HRO20872.1 RNA polymerase sigma factor FliA [Alcaligenes phenolicus]HRP13703.1 RNA polymerase sigma factor FliA [Alcaligenes phenolicus]
MFRSEDSLVEQYAPLVRRQALQLAVRLPPSVELDDLMQAGMMGLLDAVRRYQVLADAQFETYAITRIRGAMLDELRSQDWLPRSVRTKSRQIEAAISTLRHRLLREPSEPEIAQALNISLEQFQSLLEEASGVQVIHYEDLARKVEGGDALSFLEDGDPEASYFDNPLNQLVSQGLRVALMEAIDALPEREKILFSLQFEQDLNQKEIALVMGVTEGRVSQLRSQAVARIRASLVKTEWGQASNELEYQFLL